MPGHKLSSSKLAWHKGYSKDFITISITEHKRTDPDDKKYGTRKTWYESFSVDYTFEKDKDSKKMLQFIQHLSSLLINKLENDERG